jgi:hypothetical protein
VAAPGAELATADDTYRVFLRSLPKPRSSARITLPASRWVSADGSWSEPEIAAFVTTLRATASSAPVHDVAVLLVTVDPTPVGQAGDASVLPPAKSVRLHIVVANVGNEPEKNVAVIAALTTLSGSADTARDFVDLAPGQRRTVTLGGLVPIQNETFTLGVRAGPVENEGNTADNEQLRTLIMRGS